MKPVMTLESPIRTGGVQRGLGARPGLMMYLASRSPRRRELLAEHGYVFESVSSGVDDAELAPGDVSAEAWVAALAYFKAAAAVRRLSAEQARRVPAVVLGADTIVLKEGGILGQPQSEVEASRMIRTLRDGSHRVLTGVAFLDPSGQTRHTFVDVAHVRVGALADDEIDAYVSSGDWRGKAGGYNLRERLASGWPITFRGDPTTIMGLPMRALERELARWTGREVRSGGAPAA